MLIQISILPKSESDPKPLAGTSPQRVSCWMNSNTPDASTKCSSCHRNKACGLQLLDDACDGLRITGRNNYIMHDRGQLMRTAAHTVIK